MKIRPAKTLRGTIALPGDKSISHRAVMLLAIAEGAAKITNFLTAEDCLSTLRCIKQLGVEAEREGTTVSISGVGEKGLEPPEAPLDCGNSGTTARLLTGYLAGRSFDTELIGDASLSQRPMRRVIEPLEDLGGRFTSTDGRLPVLIKASKLTGAEIELSVPSAQVKSAILLAGLQAKGTTTVIEPIRTRDHTERMLKWLGASLEIEETGGVRRIQIAGGTNLAARDIAVPADISSAAFFLVAAACLPDARLKLPNVGLNPTRTGILDVLRACGANVRIGREREEGGEPVGDLFIEGGLGTQQITRLDGAVIANIIDEIPILAVFGTQLEKGLEVRDAKELRVKETDRIDSLVKDLRKMAIKVDEFDDGFRVFPGRPRGAELESFGDHRIAMAFAIAGLFASGETTIHGSEACEISFPGFFDALESVVT